MVVSTRVLQPKVSRRFELAAIQRPLLTLSALLAGASMNTACERVSAQPQDKLRGEAKSIAATHVSVPAKTRFLPEVLATGNLRPRRSAQLAMAVPGTLARIFVRRGDEVKSGAPLAALEESGARAALAQAEAGQGCTRLPRLPKIPPSLDELLRILRREMG